MRTYQFQKAMPVWLGDPQRMNALEGFYADVEFAGQELTLCLTASTFYRLFVNGDFVYAGPARCAKGFFRVDELSLNQWLKQGKNRIAIEVTSYHANSFAYPRQSGFLQAELVRNGTVIAATGDHTMPFYGFYLNHRVQKVPRYSYQRTFSEAYVLTPHTNDWRSDLTQKGELPTRAQSGTLMQRGIPHHTFPATYATWYGQGSAIYREDKSEGLSQRFIDDRRSHLNLFPVSDLDAPLHQEMFNFDFEAKAGAPTGKTVTLDAQSYIDGTFGMIKTGFFAMTLTASAPTDVYLFFSEMQDKDGQVNPCRTGECLDVIKLTLTEAGRYDFRSAEPYGGMVVRLITTKAAVTVADLRMEAYAYPAAMGDPVQPQSEKLQAIYTAAKETFAQNASDIFMDCPTRERAGWLCDSFFEGRVEWALNPEMCVERNFIENFQLPEYFECLPEGMLPMCYPSDHHKGGRHIPQWAMWFFLEVADYKKRGGDAALVAALQERYEGLYRYFQQYENELGLLENLPSWNFVEWSFANELVDGMNYPTNMLYTAFLQVGAELYGKTELQAKAEKIAETIRARAFDGTYFRDHDIRNAEDVLEQRSDCTETCQYYAFYFGIATPETYPELWKKLTTVFGPDRDAKTVEPQIHQANAFIGNYLRLEILRRYGLKEKMLSEIEGYFYGMSQRTGTLWEHMNEMHSCDHGFASYVIYLMKE